MIYTKEYLKRFSSDEKNETLVKSMKEEANRWLELPKSKSMVGSNKAYLKAAETTKGLLDAYPRSSSKWIKRTVNKSKVREGDYVFFSDYLISQVDEDGDLMNGASIHNNEVQILDFGE